MLTRLKVDGFKNLDGVDVRFGPFTCIAGPNGVGKSNLFDAIAFLAALADKPLAEAAAQVRGSQGRVGDVRSIFLRVGDRRVREMSFLAEMIIPDLGVDELGSKAKASWTFLRYQLRLRLRDDPGDIGPLEIVSERMDHITKGHARKALGFPHSKAWRDSVVRGTRRTVPYIETITEDAPEGGRAIVLIRADSERGLGGGRPRKLLASKLPRTVLSNANNAAEHRTLVLARQEMLGWTQFQLEPSALRAPDRFTDPARIDTNGAHLPATLDAMGRELERSGEGTREDLYQQVANRLAELFENVRTVRVDRDEMREQLAIVLTDLGGTEHPAGSLSDGTLRFLALAIMEAGAQGPSLMCLEEPENGIHPDRIPSMIELLQDLAVDVTEPVGPDNPMRQVIVNTHSPIVVNEVPEDSIIVASDRHTRREGQRLRLLRLRGLAGTWRADPDPARIGDLVAFLPRPDKPAPPSRTRRHRRLLDREDARQLGLFGPLPLEDE